MKIVLIWASNKPEKYWNRILKDLQEKWHDVIPVNPNEKEIEGIRSHKALSTVPKSFEVFNFVVPAKVTLQILKKYKNLLKTKKVWIQPWAEDKDVLEYLKENNFEDYITGSCIMVEKIEK